MPGANHRTPRWGEGEARHPAWDPPNPTHLQFHIGRHSLAPQERDKILSFIPGCGHGKLSLPLTTLLSLPFLGHSVIRFLNLEATQGPARDPRPHPLPAVGRPGSCGRSTTRLGPLGPGGFWGLPGKVSHDPTQLWRCRATWGHPGAGHPALGHVARHTSSRSYRAFFLLLNHGLGTKPQGGEVWTKEENEWAKGKAELRGSATDEKSLPA